MNAQYGSFTGQGMPPYSTDPALSLSRHHDPDYINSSDPFMMSSEMLMAPDGPIPSSPPPHVPKYTRRTLRSDHDDEMVVDEDDPTEDDDVTDEDMNSDPVVGSSRYFAETQSTMRAASSNSTFGNHSSFKSSTKLPKSLMAARSESSMHNVVKHAIEPIFDGEDTVINLDGQGFESVPDECRSLIDHVDLGHRLFDLNLTSNKIKIVDSFLYDIESLKYLNLRSNQIRKLSPSIGKLINLVELHLGHNRLQALPAELLTLPALATLTTYPNDFKELPTDGSTSSLKVYEDSTRPLSLKEMAGRVSTAYGGTFPYNEFKRQILQYNMIPEVIHPVLVSVQSGDICSVCRGPIVTSCHATYWHWTRHPADRSGQTVPYETRYCSLSCMPAGP